MFGYGDLLFISVVIKKYLNNGYKFIKIKVIIVFVWFIFVFMIYNIFFFWWVNSWKFKFGYLSCFNVFVLMSNKELR